MRTKLALAMLVLLLPALCWRTASAGAGDRLIGVYMMSEKEVRADVEAHLRLFADARPPRRKVTPEEEHGIEVLVHRMVYQRLIDRFACYAAHDFEKWNASLLRSEKGSQAFGAIIRCMKDRQAATAEMFEFQRTYAALLRAGDLDGKCAAKARLSDLERKFPPYEFMVAVTADYRAVDAGRYLECARRGFRF